MRRLKTDYIDLYQLHGFDAITPIEETLGTLDDLVRAGKIRYIGCSNFSGWHLMNSLAISERYGWARHVAHQAYYSLIGRDYEWELMPLGVAHKVSAIVWSPLGWARLTGKIRRGQPMPETSRMNSKLNADNGPPVSDEYLYRVVDALDAVARETGKTVPQVALNWLLQRPTVASVIIGARTRGTASPEPRCRWLAVESGAYRQAGCGECRDASLSVLASAAVRGAKPASCLRRSCSVRAVTSRLARRNQLGLQGLGRRAGSRSLKRRGLHRQ